MRIALIGPESCGKSTLAQAIAYALSLPYIAEYARTYVERLNRPYLYRDVQAIAHRQINEIRNNDNAVFDTELILTDVWFRVKYGRSPFWLQRAIETYPMDMYLVCAPDLPWVSDPTRENGDKREALFRTYLYRVQQTGVPYTIIRGTDKDKRIQQALAFIQSYCPCPLTMTERVEKRILMSSKSDIFSI